MRLSLVENVLVRNTRVFKTQSAIVLARRRSLIAAYHDLSSNILIGRSQLFGNIVALKSKLLIPYSP